MKSSEQLKRKYKKVKFNLDNNERYFRDNNLKLESKSFHYGEVVGWLRAIAWFKRK